MNVCLKPCASCTEVSQELNLSGSPTVADRPLNVTLGSGNGRKSSIITYIIGHGARSRICSQVAPPLSCPIVWISSRIILPNLQFMANESPRIKRITSSSSVARSAPAVETTS
jgi:hypothetical protein